jgi:hypothetical protein
MVKTTDPARLRRIRERLARRRVRRGAEFLDEHFPGWRKSLRENWWLVDMYTAQHCVLATAGHTRPGFRSSGDVMRAYTKTRYDGFAMGFYADDQQGGVDCKELEFAWKDLLFNQPDPPPRALSPRPLFMQKVLRLLLPSQQIAA